MNTNDFLPLTSAELKAKGWNNPDFILITGDAYVDHPSFGSAVISRLLEKNGYKVCILSQPDYTSAASFRIFGKPRLGFLVTAGNLDSMVNNYSTALHKRKTDVYSPGGKAGLRPDRATIVYSIRLREAFGRVPIILGGLEASLRRFAHYDFWQNKIRRSILLDAKADLLVYGMGETQILEIANRLQAGEPIINLTNIRGTVVQVPKDHLPPKTIILPSFSEICNSKKSFALSFKLQLENSDPFSAKPLAEEYTESFILQNPPALILTTTQLDEVYELPYTRNFHPLYEKDGGVPALSEVKFSLVAHRGCFGGCSFCSLSFHQGKHIQSRSLDSILREAQLLLKLPDFKGYIHDLGGPTANFHQPACSKQLKQGTCLNKNCLVPEPCQNLEVDHSAFLNKLRAVRNLAGVKKVFIRSGIRFDFLLADKNKTFLTELCQYHISGQLKVAPEHVSASVLKLMNKPSHQIYEKFIKAFKQINSFLGLNQYLVPYFISGHPGSSLNEAIELAQYFKQTGFIPEQVQDFYPTPGSLSTCMYYTGLNPLTLEKVAVAKSKYEKALQRALLQFHKPKNYRLVREALLKAGRKDLIGFKPNCLIKPFSPKSSK